MYIFAVPFSFESGIFLFKRRRKMKKLLLTVLTTALVLCSVLFIGAACSDGTENGNNEIYSVYQTYVAYAEANGTTPLTYEEWLKTIKGENGKDGLNGKDGADGKDGENGLSAYELYKKYHPEYTKSEEEFLDDLVNGRLGNKESENPLELDFYRQPDGTYWVSIGKAIFMEKIDIPSTNKGHAVTGIFPSGFQSGKVKSVTIPNSVKTIQEFAFAGCYQLESVIIPDSVTFIGNAVFSECGKLENVIIPDSVTSIGSMAFNGCAKLKNIIIPDGVTSVGNAAFKDCSELEKVTLPDSVKSIGESAFSGCVGLQSITIPEGVTSIGIEAFAGCTGLQNITIPEGVTSIGESAFRGCIGLQSVTIPEGVISIGSRAFDGCASLVNISIPDSIIEIGSAFDECEKIKYNECDNAKYLGNESNPYVVLMSAKDKNITSCVISEKTKIIYESAFSACEKLTSIIIPEGVRSIGGYAFEGCSELTNVSIPDSIESAVFAFTGCRKLQYNEYGNAKYLGNENNPYLVLVKGINQEITSCEVNEKTKIINSGAFSYGSLETLTVSKSVKYIGSEIFWSNRHEVNITYTGTKEQWKTIVKSPRWWNVSSVGAVHCTDGDLSKDD